MITIEQAKALKPGDIIWVMSLHKEPVPLKFKVNGQPKVWKRDQHRVRVPVKHGLYTYGAITEENINLIHLTYPEKEGIK